MNIRPMGTPADWLDSESDWAETHTKLTEAELDRFIAGRTPVPAAACSACVVKCESPQACEQPDLTAHHKHQRRRILIVAVVIGTLIVSACVAGYLRLLRWQLACLLDEQRLYIDAGHAGPIFERESRQQQLAVMARIRQLEHFA